MASDIRQVVRFLITGCINTGVGFGIIFAMMLVGVAPLHANIVGYACGLCVSFLLNRNWVFKQKRSTIRQQAFKFGITFVIAYTMNLMVLQGALLWDINPYIAQIIAGVTYTLCFYVLSRFFVFA